VNSYFAQNHYLTLLDFICIIIYIYAYGGHMRTTLDLPQDLLTKAMTLSNSNSKTSTITLALNELIRKLEISELKNYRGKTNLDIDLNTLRKRS
jgi:hypothetical protein